MINSIRLQVAVFIILLFILANYISAPRRRTITHRFFTFTLIVAMVNVLFDGSYSYALFTYGYVSDILSRGYLISLVGFLSCTFMYFYTDFVLPQGQSPKLKDWMNLSPVAAVILFNLFWPIQYVREGEWVHSSGLVVVMTFLSASYCIIGIAITLLRSKKSIPMVKKVVSGSVLMLMVISFLLQAIFMQILITSFGVVFIILSIYILSENPDSLLIEQLQYEKERADSANVSKSSFIAHVSHEIRTPINAIIGMNEMILRNTKEDNISQYSQDISVAAYALYGIINDVLDMSKMESGKMEIFPVKYDLDRLIYDSVVMIQPRIEVKQLDFEVEINPTIPKSFFGDEIRIKQVLSNLMSNAVKYTHQGSVKLKVEGAFHGEDMDLTFTVEDTGIGIKEEDINRLFVAFERIEESRNRNIEGTGLGMNITNTLLKLMGSRLKVESVYGEGSSFSFTVTQRIINSEPIGDYNVFAQAQEKVVSIDFVAPSVRLLVVDDNTLNRKVFCSLFEGTKMIIDEAEGGYECLKLIREHQYDIIFMDHLMPEIDGIETMIQMKDDPDHMNNLTPVVMLTANAIGSIQEEYQKAGFTAYLTKPIFATDLERILRAYIPAYKITETKKTGKIKTSDNWKEDLPPIRGIDWKEAISHLPTYEILISTLKEFHRNIETDAAKMDKHYMNAENDEELNLLRIEVHALKGAALLIGAEMLSDGALEVEQAAKDKDLYTLRERYPYMINYYRSFIEKLEPFDNGSDDELIEEIDFPQVIALAQMVKLEMNDMNLDGALTNLEELEAYKYPKEIREEIEELKKAVNSYNMDLVDDISESLVSKFRDLKNRR